MREPNYISEIPISHRQAYGQFFTPASVAYLMAEWVMKEHPQTVLDPAFGLGIFYDQINQISLDKNLQFIGYEIDQNIINYLNIDGSKTNLKIINSDYLAADIGNFDGIICNPPYMKFQKFRNRHDVLPKIERKIGKKLVGYANIASIFLVKALQELNLNGRLAFIMPLEFFNAGYGKEIKKSLLNDNLLKQIIIFANEKDIFPEAITTVCVLFCKNDGQPEAIKITQIKSSEELQQISDINNFYQQQIELSDLPYNKKWTPIILSLFSQQNLPDISCKLSCKLSLYGAFSRGIATGANDFFALNKSKIKDLRIDENNLCKCITKSQQIRKVIFTEDDFYVLYNRNKSVYCLDVKNHDLPEICDYIKHGEILGYHQRYLTRKRKPWYKIERRKPAPILLGVFSRQRLKVIRNMTTAISFTCFHSFYPNVLGESLIDKLFVYLLSDVGQKIIKSNKRIYGDNLDKFEPGDLNDSLFPSPMQFAIIDDREAREVIEIAKIDERLAIKMSNQLIEKIINEEPKTD
ncbi:N-6 DNA methylase [Oscillatoriales cyanobacterium USR001]|nr:N-6 DNA methylase [Oscillatoriales cyanobacterium USR001]